MRDIQAYACNQTYPVGGKKPNAWGLYDMHGNVWEWCREAYIPYAPGAVTDPVGESTGNFLVLRGGAWNNQPVFLRSAFNGSGEPTVRNNCLRACFKIASGAAARDFGWGQGGEAGASPMWAVTAEPTPAPGERPAARRVFAENSASRNFKTRSQSSGDDGGCGGAVGLDVRGTIALCF
jgi:hypothetical protein